MISMPEDKIFIDTNIMIYAYDVSAEEKHQIAGHILSDLWNSYLNSKFVATLFSGGSPRPSNRAKFG